MALRDTLTERPAVTNAITVVVILLAAAFIAVDVLRPRPASVEPQLFFTTDDGETYFPDSASHLPPYDVNGKPAVRAYVYACASGKPFVAYLERYTPETVAKLSTEEARTKGLVDQELVIAEGTEVKRHGDKEWVLRRSDAGQRILDIKCPEGDSGIPMMKLPGD